MNEMLGYKVACYDRLEELYTLYDKVRQSIILAENFDKERKMYVAPINQLRSALDHIFKAVNSAENEIQSEYELKEAKEHLDRAGYDALELLAASLGNAIVEKVAQYDTKALTAVFPTYFTEIKPKITDIKNCVATLRTDKKIDSEKSFSAYFDQITELIDIDKKVDTMIPSLEEFKQKERKSERKVWIWGLLSSIASGLIVGLLVYYFTNQ